MDWEKFLSFYTKISENLQKNEKLEQALLTPETV